VEKSQGHLLEEEEEGDRRGVGQQQQG